MPVDNAKTMADFYQQQCDAYHRRTVNIDPSSFLKPLIHHIASGAKVIDVGCGSGRDVLWLKKHGFKVKGFERSPGLADLARRHAGCAVIEGDFENYDFSRMQVDAILLVGALVHVEHGKMPAVFKNITAGLNSGGKVLLTLKKGRGTYADESGRRFYLWQDQTLRKLFGELDFEVLDFRVQPSKVNAGDTWLGYVLEKC